MVYVGPLFNCKPYRSKSWRYTHACHLLSEDLDELHMLAKKIGLKRAWFQDHGTPHYDLNKSKRLRAIEAGAIEIDMNREAQLIRAWRLKRKGDNRCPTL